MSVQSLDETDVRLLEILQENCKLNFTQIGNKLGIAESTVRYRIDRLEKRGIITNYIALVNPRKVGLTYSVSINLPLSEWENALSILIFTILPIKFSSNMIRLSSQIKFTALLVDVLPVH